MAKVNDNNKIFLLTLGLYRENSVNVITANTRYLLGHQALSRDASIIIPFTSKKKKKNRFRKIK